jgi:putative ATP-grasp target RiPP
VTRTPWGFERMAPLDDTPSTVTFSGLDPTTQTGLWVGPNGHPLPAELGKHGTQTPTRPATATSHDGTQDSDQGQDFNTD